MIPNSRSLVTLQPARQAALQAILDVETRRSEGRRLPELPYVRTFLRILTGSSRINTDVARRIPGLNWHPKNRLVSLKQVEAALEILLASHGEKCPLPLPIDIQGELSRNSFTIIPDANATAWRSARPEASAAKPD